MRPFITRHCANKRPSIQTMGLLFIIGLAFCIITNVSAGDEDDMMSCLELFNPEGIEKNCCETMESAEKLRFDFEECLKHDSDDWLCEDFQCILKKTDMLKGDKIDEEGAKKFYDNLLKDYPKEKSMIDRVKRECLDGKYESYPPEDACPAVKYYVCSYINAFLECESWKTVDVCSKMADNAKKCKSVLGD